METIMGAVIGIITWVFIFKCIQLAIYFMGGTPPPALSIMFIIKLIARLTRVR